MKYYTVTQLHTERVKTFCVTFDYYEALKVQVKLSSRFAKEFENAKFDDTKEFVFAKWMHETKEPPKTETNIVDVESIFDNVNDTWLHRPKLNTIEIKTFNKLKDEIDNSRV